MLRNIRNFSSLALEGIEGAIPPTFNSTESTEQLVENLQVAESQSLGHAEEINQSQQSILALESIARSLGKPEARSMGKMGAHYLNLATEQFVLAGGSEMRELPLDPARFERSPDDALQSAETNVRAAAADVSTATAQDVVGVLGTLIQKRESLTLLIRKMHHRVDEIMEDVEGLKTGSIQAVKGAGALGYAHDYRHICYNGKGIVAKGATVASDVVNFLAEHTALYKRLTDKPSTWVRQHKDIAAFDTEGFSQYSFNPAEYLMAGAQFSHRGNGYAVFKGAELPGGLYVYCATVEDVRFGHDAVDAMMVSKVFLDTDSHMTATSGEPEGVIALTPTEIEARAKEMTAALHRLSDWSKAAHATMWKDALFEQTLVSALLTTNASTVNDRGVGCLAGATVKLLNEASSNVGSSVIKIFEDMLRLMEDSLRVYVPNHIDGAQT